MSARFALIACIAASLGCGVSAFAAEQGAAFNHDRDTTFPLQGRHATVKCDACHRGLLFQEKLGTQCVDCHRADDVHKGRQGLKCEECHAATKWNETRFDHDRTEFKLLGRHRAAACVACHKGDSRDMKLETRCASCHQADDVHKGQLGPQCQTCHNEEGWRQQVAFDHDLTRFPLIGLHATTACVECHLTAAYKDAKSACVACHRTDDAHKQTLGTECAACHTPNGWRIWAFDHDTQTKFTLEGKHRGLRCEACHRMPVTGKAVIPDTCVSCHDRDDVHHGEFGRRCDRCHTVDSFRDIKVTP